MRKQKTKTSPIWHRLNGRLCKFDNVEDMKRFQIQLANSKTAAEASPVCGEVVPLDSDGEDPS